MYEFRVTYKVAPGYLYEARVVMGKNVGEATKMLGQVFAIRSITMRCSHEECKRWSHYALCWQHGGPDGREG